MVLHTIISEYDIFRNESDFKQPQFMDIQNGFIEFDEYNGEKRVLRLHSTDPSMYLKDEYSPYTIIR